MAVSAPRDQNNVPVLMGTSSTDGVTPVVLWADPDTHRLLTQSNGGAAPASATYVTLSTNATLTNERVLTGTSNQVTITDNGAGSTVVLSLPQSIATSSTPTFASMTLTAASSLTLGTASTNTGAIIFKNSSNANNTTLQAGAAGAALTFTLPTTDGNAGEFLQTDGNGVMSWAAGASGANTALSNLASVALNTALLPDAAAADDFGSATLPFKDYFLAGSSGTPGTNNFRITGASTSGTRVITLPDATDTLVGKATTDTLTNKTISGASNTITNVSLTAGVTGVLPVANGGTNANSASITAFNNITGYTAAGATGTTSTNLVFSTSPTLVTPVLGAATATSINGLTITSSTGTLTITNAKTLSVSNTLTLAGTDSTVMTFPTTSATIARTDAGQTFTGVQVMTSPSITTSLTTGSSTFDLLNATATTINFAGASGSVVNLGGGANAAELRFLEPSGSGTNYTAFKAQAQGANITYTLPATVGAAGTFLTDAAGNGTLSWAAAAGAGAYQYLGNAVSSASASSLSSGTITNKRNLRVLIWVAGLSAGGDCYLRINGDSGAVYAWSVSASFGAPTTGASDSLIKLDTSAGTLARYFVVDILNANDATNPICFKYHGALSPAISVAPTNYDGAGTYDNNTAITSIVLHNNGGNFTDGTTIAVFGMNDDGT